MKLFKTALLALTLATSVTAFAEDVVNQQIRLTQNSIRLAQEQAQAGILNQSNHSLDGDQKQAKLNAAIPQVLARFESDVRLKLLSPMQAVINQYNSIAQSQQYDAATKATILTNLKNQLTSMASSRNRTYFDTVGALERPLSEIVPFGRYLDHSWHLISPAGNLLTTESNYVMGVVDQTTASVGKSCFTKNCFYSSLNSALLWSTIVESLLGKKIDLKLIDNEIISIASNGVGDLTLVGAQNYADVTGSSLVDSLPADISSGRLQFMQQIQVVIDTEPYDANRCYSQVRNIEKEMCKSAEGCVTNVEEPWLEFVAANGYYDSNRSACLTGQKPDQRNR